MCISYNCRGIALQVVKSFTNNGDTFTFDTKMLDEMRKVCHITGKKEGVRDCKNDNYYPSKTDRQTDSHLFTCFCVIALGRVCCVTFSVGASNFFGH